MSALGRARVHDTLAWDHSEAPLLVAYTHPPPRHGAGLAAREAVR
jgi:hypothetical protein